MRVASASCGNTIRIKWFVVLVVAAIGVFSLIDSPARIEQVAAKPVPANQGCPVKPVVDIGGTAVPNDVCIPAGFGGLPIEYFDDFSWKAFIALVWPAEDGKREAPDLTKTVADPGPRVFETYKNLWEVFHADGSEPAPWNIYDSANPCRMDMQFGEVMLASFSKFGDLGQAGFGDLLGPIVAQNRTYVRFATAFNRIEFDQITQNKWYLRKVLDGTKSLAFRDGAIDIKSAWIEMDGIPNPGRYYTRTAIIMDPGTGNCSRKTVGLVGLHIVVKTPSRPQWIWSSFEHIDTVPGGPDSSGTFSLHDGTATAMPVDNPYKIDPLVLPPPAPFNILRVKPIHASTQATNAAYRQKLKEKNSVWQFYQLVTTQWPVPGNVPANPGNPNFSFPGKGSDKTAFANTTMETFEQEKITTSCMACHNFTGKKTDFLWVLNNHAFPSKVPPAITADPVAAGKLKDPPLNNAPLEELRQLLKENRKATNVPLPKKKLEKLKLPAQPKLPK